MRIAALRGDAKPEQRCGNRREETTGKAGVKFAVSGVQRPDWFGFGCHWCRQWLG